MNGLIKDAAAASLAAYPGKPAPAELGFCERVPLKSDLLPSVIYITGDILWIFFPGTTRKRHWITNLRAYRTDFYGMRAHSGFSGLARSFLPQIDGVRVAYPNHHLILGGHSLGGAVAALCGAAISDQTTVITFGQPKTCAGPEIEKHMGGDYVRVQNGSDLVVRLPHFHGFDGGHLVYIANNGEIIMNPSWWDRFKDRTIRLSQFQRLGDHHMTDYKREVYRAL